MNKRNLALAGALLAIGASVMMLLPSGENGALPALPQVGGQAKAPSPELPPLTGQAAADLGADTAFLDEVLRLKKEKVLAELKNEIHKLDVSPESTPPMPSGLPNVPPPMPSGFAAASPVPPPPTGLPGLPAADAPKPVLLAVNAAQGVAVFQVGDQIIRAKVGDRIGDARLVALRQDAAAFRQDGHTSWVYPSRGAAVEKDTTARPVQ